MPPLRIRLVRSRHALILFTWFAWSVAFALYLANLETGVKLILAIAWLWLTCSGYRQLGWLGGKLPTALRFDGRQTWLLDGLEVEPVPLQRVTAVYVSPWFTGMQFELYGRRRRLSLALFADSTDADTFRRLRVVLRHGQKSWAVQEPYL